eukprot:jgi/Chlat1/8127/Chrsp75S07576
MAAVWRRVAEAAGLAVARRQAVLGEWSLVRAFAADSAAATTSGDSAAFNQEAAAANDGASGFPRQYEVVGRIAQAQYRVQQQQAFAVVEVGPHQFKVTPDDVVYTEKLKGVEVNDKVKLNRVLLLGSQACTVVGRPFVPEASVLAACESQFRDAKVVIFKKKRRKNYRRTAGHRQELTALRILDVQGLPSEPQAADAPELARP